MTHHASGHGFRPYSIERPDPAEQLRRAREMRATLDGRRSVRHFSSDPVDRKVLEELVQTAATAPSGANKQPWQFVVVTEAGLKRRIREAAEKEEKESYERRMPQEWLDDLDPLGTDWHKEFLETAPALIVVFAEKYALDHGSRRKHYYVMESVGIAVGFLLVAIHNAGLAALTHTPSPMDFLASLLERPENERPFLLIPVGYPAPGAQVPDISRKTLDDVLTWR